MSKKRADKVVIDQPVAVPVEVSATAPTEPVVEAAAPAVEAPAAAPAPEPMPSAGDELDPSGLIGDEL